MLITFGNKYTSNCFQVQLWLERLFSLFSALCIILISNFILFVSAWTFFQWLNLADWKGNNIICSKCFSSSKRIQKSLSQPGSKKSTSQTLPGGCEFLLLRRSSDLLGGRRDSSQNEQKRHTRILSKCWFFLGRQETRMGVLWWFYPTQVLCYGALGQLQLDFTVWLSHKFTLPPRVSIWIKHLNGLQVRCAIKASHCHQLSIHHGQANLQNSQQTAAT